MVAYVETGGGEAGVVTVRGAALLRCPVPAGEGWLARWRRSRRFRALARRGVRYAIVPPEYAAEAAKWAIRSVDPWPVRQMAGLRLLEGRRGTLAALRSPGLSPAVEAAAVALCRGFRYVRLSVPGGEALAYGLLRHFGVGGAPPGAAALTVSFGGAPEAEGELCLGEDCTRYQAAAYAPVDGLAPLPQSEALLYVLWQAGAVKGDEIVIKSITSLP